jgi:hypothetical protein
MKKSLLVSILLTGGILSGCSVPFIPSEKEAVVSYLDNNASLIGASDEFNKELIKSLKEEGVSGKEKAERVEHVIKEQQTLYDQIKMESSPLGNARVKYIYLTIINERIETYDTFLSYVYDEKSNALLEAVKSHEIKDRKIKEQALIKINQELVELGEEEKKTLMKEKK